jgi:cell division protein ZapA
MGAKKTATTEVEIFGSVYQVRSEKDPEYLRQLAGLVDEKMREIAQHVATIDATKLAILAALNVTDELFQCRTRQDGERVEIQEKVEQLTGRLREALQG